MMIQGEIVLYLEKINILMLRVLYTVSQQNLICSIEEWVCLCYCARCFQIIQKIWNSCLLNVKWELKPEMLFLIGLGVTVLDPIRNPTKK